MASPPDPRHAFLGWLLGLGFLVACAPSQTAEPRATSGSVPASDPLRILFVGDTYFGESYQEQLAEAGGTNLLEAKGYDHSLARLDPLLRSADLVIANLETSLTTLSRSPLPGRKQLLRGHPVTARVLRAHGIGAVSLANNHAMDYGGEGLRQTLETLAEHGIEPFGAGLDEDAAARPFRRDLRVGSRVVRLVVSAGFEHRTDYEDGLGFYAEGGKPGVNAWSPRRAAAQLRELRAAEPDAFIVAFPHWGANYRFKSPAQSWMGVSLLNAGADLVLGHGAHMLQEVEPHRAGWIVHGLGNFVFNSPGSYPQRGVPPFSLAACLELTDAGERTRVVLKLVPIFSDNRSSGYQPYPLSTEELERVRELLVTGQAGEAVHHELGDALIPGRDPFGPFLEIMLDPL